VPNAESLEEQMQSIYVKEALEMRIKVIHSWTRSFEYYQRKSWYGMLRYNDHRSSHMGPFSSRAALIQSCYERVWFRVWMMVK